MADRALAERGAPVARRDEGEYWTYLTDEQRSGRDPQPAKRREPFDTSFLEPVAPSPQTFAEPSKRIATKETSSLGRAHQA